CLQSKDSPWTF
nr:immunoglobulin light chain junction region [Macaca mulatta]MOV62900.1 immunoglobulin light chain junction region [Macaca mulatta]MOV79467.1 immunoglobulin light chain junction region [Macaca mulatta]